MKTFLTTTVLTAVLAGTAQAATLPVVNYTFEGDTLGSPASGWTGSNGTPGFNVVADTNNYFGQGVTNKVMNFIDNDTNQPESVLTDQSFDLGSGTGADQFGTIRFEVVFLSGTGGSAGLGTGNLNNGGNKAAVASLTAIATDYNQLYTLSILVNNTGSAKSFFNPVTNLTDSIASSNSSGRFFAYKASTGTYTELLENTGTQVLTNSIKFGFSNFSSAVNSILVDNITTSNDLVVVPEPASLALIGLGTLCLLGGRRRL